MQRKILVKVTVVEITGGLAKEEVDKVHDSLIPGSKAQTAEGILAVSSLHQRCKTSKLSVVLWKAWPL